MNSKHKKAFEDHDFILSREARPIRILSEYIEPEKRFKEYQVSHTVVFFGSARIYPGGKNSTLNKYYNEAEEFAFRLASMSEDIKRETGEKYYICTGGGAGIMEAANKGAMRAGERNIGLNIELPFEQNPNQYISPELNFEFHYFFMRKLWFLYQAKALIVFPGGFGTMDELFETLTLVQTKKLEKINVPIVLFGKKFWEKAVNFKMFADEGLISPEDLDLFHVIDSVDEGIAFVKPRLIEIMQNTHKLLEKKFPI